MGAASSSSMMDRDAEEVKEEEDWGLGLGVVLDHSPHITTLGIGVDHTILL